MTFDHLDSGNLLVAAQAIKMVALAVEALGKTQYAPWLLECGGRVRPGPRYF